MATGFEASKTAGARTGEPSVGEVSLLLGMQKVTGQRSGYGWTLSAGTWRSWLEGLRLG